MRSLPTTSSFASSPFGAAGIRPNTGPWLCGQPPSAKPRVDRGVPLAEGYHSLYAFKAQPDGALPYGNLVLYGKNLYGTTDLGGSSQWGSVFEITPSGKERIVYSFGGKPDGAYPCDGLLIVKNTFYGTTQTGGAYGWGTVFSVTPSGQERVLYSFKGGRDAAVPYAGLLYLNGKLYGTTVEGGKYGWGAIYAVAAGKEHVLYSFKAGTKDGAYPYSKLIAIKNVLVGTTMGGGNPGWGTVFACTLTGKEHIVHSFKASNSDGAYPFDALTEYNGTFYGTTKEGGKIGYGAVFSLTTSGKEHLVYSFKGGNKDGAYPYGGLTELNGVLYGTTISGNPANWGTIFAVTPSGKERVVYSFKAGADGASPFSRLVNDKGTLYGTAEGGGGSPAWGTVFAYTP
ncbi:MAG: hypothetical protein JO263_03930 [Candidatus Eremiobacteraeota bacterium]|nr:hypothetical protein [Candidatus Eremiobacteraeota bacterium]